MDIVRETLTPFNDDPEFFKYIITSSKSWVYHYYIETKIQTFPSAKIGEIKNNQNRSCDTKKRVSQMFTGLEKRWHE